MRVRLGACLAGLALSFAACGGRTLEGFYYEGNGGSDGSGDGGSNSLGAKSGKGGTSAGGKGTGTGGKKSSGAGGKASGGSVGVAGSAAAGGVCGCPAIACGPGYMMTPDAAGCCSHCEPACPTSCPDIGCGRGTHFEMPAGQCCPVCVPDSCELQRASYEMFRQQLIDKYSGIGCMTNNDCGTYYEKNECAVGCGIPMANSGIQSLDSNLRDYAQQQCSPGCMPAVPPCDPTVLAVCVGGLCR